MIIILDGPVSVGKLALLEELRAQLPFALEYHAPGRGETKEETARAYQAFLEVIRLEENRSIPVLIDEAITDREVLKWYLKELAHSQPIYFVEVKSGHLDHSPGIIPHYDLGVNLNCFKPNHIAHQILDYVKKNPLPRAYQRICSEPQFFNAIYKPSQDPVELWPADTSWFKVAQKEILRLKENLSFLGITDIQHIGSTAIEGLKTTPVVDIMIGLQEFKYTHDVRQVLEELDYIYWPQEITGDALCFVKGIPPFGVERQFQLYVVQQHSYEWFAHQLFRDHLRTHEGPRKEYQALKEGLAQRYSLNREEYIQGKTTFIHKVVEQLLQIRSASTAPNGL